MGKIMCWQNNSLLFIVTISMQLWSAGDTFKCQTFDCHFGFNIEKCILMSTNKPSIGPVVLEI